MEKYTKTAITTLVVILLVIAIIIRPAILLAIVGALSFFGGIILFLLALSKIYVIYGKMEENTFMSIEDNGRFVGMKVSSKILDFEKTGGQDGWWELKKKDGGPKLDFMERLAGLTAISKDSTPKWPISKARWYVIETNDHKFIHPTEDGKVGYYRIIPRLDITRNPGFLITHTFTTSPIVTIEPQTGAKTSVVGLFQVQLFVFNPYLFTYMTPDAMKNVNQTLQSGSRELTATFSYIAFISARSEGGEKKLSAGDREIVRDYGKELKKTVKNSLAKYGVKILDPDFIDAYLSDPRLEKAQNDIQIKVFEAEGRKVETESKSLAKERTAYANAADLYEKMKVVKNAGLTAQQQQLLEAEIAATAHVQGMEKFTGSVYSNGGAGTSAIVDIRKPEKGEAGSSDNKQKSKT